MMRACTISVLVLLLACGGAVAQEAEDPVKTAEDAARERIEDLRERLKRAIRLPGTAEQSRDAGVPDGKVREVIEAARTRGVSAGDIQTILVTENEAVKAGGNPENFGAVVQELKDAGLRGRALAEAIHAEQIARGMKKPKKKDHPGQGAGKSKGKGKGKR